MSYASDGLRASLESNPVFQAVPAVRSGHYLPVSLDTISALRLPSVLSIPYGLDQLEPAWPRRWTDAAWRHIAWTA